MLVVGGYNSSNTNHLAELCRERGVRTMHIADSDAIDVASGAIRHQPGIRQPEQEAMGWLEGVHEIGLTAGASTPNNKIGETIARVCAVAGVEFTL
jgi:4-hydroxy-3-methylbut-2-enyl diphosphate reductase